MLTLRERALIFRACWDHPVASCARCRRSFRSIELAGDIWRALSTLCPTCRLDLTDSMREHLIACVVAAGLDAQNVRAEAKALVEATTALRKEARQHRDAAAVARAESEASRQRREDDAKPSEKTILQHVALVLADAGRVCARCLAHDDGVTPDDVTQQLQVIAATISIMVDHGTCRVCGRQDNVFAFGDGQSAPRRSPERA